MKTSTSRSSVRAKNTLGTQNLNVSKITAEDVDVNDALQAKNTKTITSLQIPVGASTAGVAQSNGQMIYTTGNNRLNIYYGGAWHYLQLST